MSVFLDHASTTSLRESSKSALIAALSQTGNPSSVHSSGQVVREILEDSRDKIAKAVNCNRSEVIFLSGGTEANNQAIKGIFWQQHHRDSSRRIIVTSATEHHALLDPALWLEANEGAEVHFVDVLPNGMIDLDALEGFVAANHQKIALISLMAVNNETGVITDLNRVCEIAAKFGVLVHTDAVAGFCHVPIDFARTGLSAMSISGHKVGAPIGIGALIVKRDLKPESLLHGGGQERGLRSGTMNFASAAAFAAAATEAISDMEPREKRLGELRNRLEAEVLAAVPDAIITARGAERASHNAHFIFPGTQSDSLLFLLDQKGINVSSGSACQAGVLGPSHVLIGMGIEESLAKACIRVTLGHTTTESDVEAFIDAISEAVEGAKKAQGFRN